MAYRAAKKKFNDWLFSQDGERFCRNFNIANNLYWRLPLSVEWNPTHNKIVVCDGSDRIFIARPRRVRRYSRGISARLDTLADEYLLRRVNFSDGDYVVDCGANVGEVGAWLRRKGENIKIISVEPEKLEAECCDLNVYDGQPGTIRKALWNEDTKLSFYSNNDSGDSSAFKAAECASVQIVESTTLTAIMGSGQIPVLKLLKLEAEGAEPEILSGAEDCLHRIEYIAADLGPERGPSHETTAAAAINFLVSRNFEVVDVRAGRLVCLFRNRNF